MWATREVGALLTLPVAWAGLFTATALGLSRSVPCRRVWAGAVLAGRVAVIVAAGSVLRAVG